MGTYETQPGGSKMPDVMGKRESTPNRLERRKIQLKEELAAVEQALQLFKDHPEIPDALDLLGRISF